MPSITDYITELQGAQEKANKANLKRYKSGLRQLKTGRKAMRRQYGKASAALKQIGATSKQDVKTGAKRALAQGRQDLIGSGLFNTTLTSNLARGVESDRARGIARINEGLAGQRAGLATQRAGAEMQAAGGISQFIANRQDVGPDPALYSGLIQAAAGASGGTPGRVSVFGGLGPNASAGLDAFGQKLGSGGGGGGGGSGLSQGGLFNQGGGGQPQPTSDDAYWQARNTQARDLYTQQQQGAAGGLDFSGLLSSPGLTGRGAVDPAGEMNVGAQPQYYKDYGAYKKAKGKGAVSAMYYNQVLGGRSGRVKIA